MDTSTPKSTAPKKRKVKTALAAKINQKTDTGKIHQEEVKRQEEGAQLAQQLIQQYGTPMQQLVVATGQSPTRIVESNKLEPRASERNNADLYMPGNTRHVKFGDILKSSPEIDYTVYEDARTPHIVPRGYTVSYNSYQKWERDLVAQGGVARFLNASEDHIDGTDPLPDGYRRTYGVGVTPFKMNMAVWKANALYPARLATLAHRFGLPSGEAWILEMIYTGSTYGQIASILGMRTSMFIDYVLENVDPVRLKTIKASKSAALLDMAEDTAISVLALPEDATPAEIEVAEARARNLSSVTGLTKFVATARVPEFSSIKAVGTGQTAHINISFNPED